MIATKFVLLSCLLSLSFGMESDEDFTSGTKYYTYKPSFTTRTFRLVKQSNDYYEIISYNCILTIYEGDNEVTKLSNNDEAYYFKYDSNLQYYLVLEIPSSSFTFFGFYVQIGDTELNILTSSLTLHFAGRREFSLGVKNSEVTPKIIQIEINMNYNVAIESTTVEENGIAFNPFSNIITQTNIKYYMILNDELTFKPIVYWTSTINYFRSATVKLTYLDNSICEDKIQCLSSDVAYYKMINPTNKNFYDITFKGDPLIYNIRDNFNYQQAISGNKYEINDYGYLLVNATGNEVCFSVMFTDEKNSISTDTNLNLYLFDTSDYKYTFIGEKKYIQIKYSKNDYFTLKIYLEDKNEEINYRYFNSRTNEYFFIFEKVSNELSVRFNLEKIKDFTTKYYKMEINYKGLDKDIEIETINENILKCFDEISFFNITYNALKPFIFLSTNGSSYIYINDEQLKNIESNNNFYSFNEDKKMEIFASSDYIICLDLKYEIENGVFAIDRNQKENFLIPNDCTMSFHLTNLIPEMRYHFDVEKKNININYYELGGKRYSYPYNDIITFGAESNEINLSLLIRTTSTKVMGNLTINFYYIENINEYTYKCLDRIHYYDLSYNEEKKYIYLSINDKLNTYLDNIALKDTPQSNNFYALDTSKRLDIYASEENIICFELFYESKNGFFELDEIQIVKFNIISENNFVFNLLNILPNSKYYIEIESNNVSIPYYKLGDEQFNFNNEIEFTSEKELMKFELPISLKDINVFGNISIYYYYIEPITNDLYKSLNTIKYYNIKYDRTKAYLYLLINDKENTYLNNKRLDQTDSTNNFYAINEDADLRIYASKSSIINFELMYQKNNGEFELELNQTLSYNIMLDNYFIFKLIGSKKDKTYLISINNDKTNIEYYMLQNKKYTFSNFIQMNGTSEENKLEFPVTLVDKNIQGDISISFNPLYYIDNDKYECLDSPKFYIIKYNSAKPYVYILTNDTENIFLNNETFKNIYPSYKFLEIKEDTVLRIFADVNNIISYELKYQDDKYDFNLSPGQTLKFKVIKDNKFSFKLIDLVEFEYYNIDIENGTSEIEYYYINSQKEKFENKILFKAYNKKVDFYFTCYPKSGGTIEQLSIHLYKREKKDDEKTTEDEEPKDYSGAVTFATYCAYVCAGIILVPLLLFIIASGGTGACGVFYLLFAGAVAFPYKKFAAVYLCKRY